MREVERTSQLSEAEKALRFKMTVDDRTHDVNVKQPNLQPNASTVTVDIDGKVFSVAITERDENSGAMKLKVNEKEYKVLLGDRNVQNGKTLNVRINEAPFRIRVDTMAGTQTSASEARATTAGAGAGAEGQAPKPSARVASTGGKIIRPPMPGKIISVRVKEGDAVKAGEVVLILEAMKMANEITSPYTGKVKEVKVSAGQSVAPEDVVISIE